MVEMLSTADKYSDRSGLLKMHRSYQLYHEAINRVPVVMENPEKSWNFGELSQGLVKF